MFGSRDAWWSTQRHSLDQSRGNCSQPRLELLEDRTLLNAGDVDPAFGTAGKLVTDFSGPIPASADAAVIQPDGKIVVAGTGTSHGPSFPPTPNNRDLLLARYNSDGTLDTGFGNSGQVNTPFFGAGQYVADNHQVKGLAIAPDGKIVVVGQHLDNS